MCNKNMCSNQILFTKKAVEPPWPMGCSQPTLDLNNRTAATDWGLSGTRPFTYIAESHNLAERCYRPHFADKETEAEKMLGNLRKVLWQCVAKLGFKLRSDSRAHAFSWVHATSCKWSRRTGESDTQDCQFWEPRASSIIHLLIHSFICSFTHSLTYSFTHSSIHSFIHSFNKYLASAVCEVRGIQRWMTNDFQPWTAPSNI